MFKQPPPAPTASAKALALLSSKLVGRPGTGSLPSTFAPPDHPRIGSTKAGGKSDFLTVLVFLLLHTASSLTLLHSERPKFRV